LNRLPKLKQVLLNEINQYDKVNVEFVSGATPTVHLFDVDGNDVDSFILGDVGLEQVLNLFEQHGFKLNPKNTIQKDASPSSVTEIGNVYYELYSQIVNYKLAREFAESKNRGGSGRLLSYNCSFQESHIRKWLSQFKIYSVWLGGERNNDRILSWTSGPLSGITFEGNASQYSNWVKGEPNNAGGNEACAVQNLKELSGWNDVNCISHMANVVVEYGKVVVPCPVIVESEKNQEKYDPNFPLFQTGDEVNL
jgi:hypothetical protein